MIDLFYHVAFLHDYNKLNNRQNNDHMVRNHTWGKNYENMFNH